MSMSRFSIFFSGKFSQFVTLKVSIAFSFGRFVFILITHVNMYNRVCEQEYIIIVFVYACMCVFVCVCGCECE